MKLKNKILFWLFIFILTTGSVLILQSFKYNQSPRIAVTNDTYWPSKRELRRKLREIRKEILVYGTNNTETAESYKQLAEKYARQMRWIDTIVKPDSIVSSDEIAATPLLMIGTASSNSVLAKIQQSLPFDINANEFSIGQVSYADINDVLILSTYPNPLNTSLPISVISGNSDQGVIDFLTNQYRWSIRAGDFRVFRDGQGVAVGFFKQKKNGPWIFDSSNSRNYLDLTQKILETPHYIFIYHGRKFSEKNIQEFANKQERRIANLLEHLENSSVNLSSFAKIEYHLYESLEDKGLITGNTDLSHFNSVKRQVHAIFNEELNGCDFYCDAKLIFNEFVDHTESRALQDGAGIYFSKNWGKHGYQYWASLFYKTGNVNALADLLNSDTYNQESYLFMRPLAGSFVEYLIAEYGWSDFLELYKNWPRAGLPEQNLTGFTNRELELGWLAFLDRLDSKIEGSNNTNNFSFQPEFQKGFSYAHEGYQIYNGYISRKSFESLQKLRSLGTDWISLSPYGYLDNRNNPGYLHYSFGASSENDESIISAFLSAKKLGLRSMLKPHILMRGGNWGWPGEIEMQNEEDWQMFFKYYYSWIRHYALLADMYEMDIFCIGVELMETTRDHQAEWREIIARIRQIYHGPIVYAANWYEEFEQITFWDELDYIGLNLYYPLSKKDTVTLTDLKEGMQTGLPIIEKIVLKYNKPLLLTEVGFTSSAASWQNPHERKRRASVVLEDQALSYKAIFESFWDKEWFYGFYWWKWPTYLENGGEQHNGFTPNGKPAEEVVKRWYSKIKPIKPGLENSN